MTNEIVVIGASSGGLKAAQLLLSALDPGFPLPVVIVQHRERMRRVFVNTWRGAASYLSGSRKIKKL